MSIISCMQYIAEYHNILLFSTIGLSTQGKYSSAILNVLVQLLIIHVLMILSFIKHSNAILAIIAMSMLAIIVILYFNIAQPYFQMQAINDLSNLTHLTEFKQLK